MNDFTIHISANNPTLALTLSAPFSLSRHLNLSFAKLSPTRNQNLNIKKGIWGKVSSVYLQVCPEQDFLQRLISLQGPTCIGPDLYYGPEDKQITKAANVCFDIWYERQLGRPADEVKAALGLEGSHWYPPNECIWTCICIHIWNYICICIFVRYESGVCLLSCSIGGTRSEGFALISPLISSLSCNLVSLPLLTQPSPVLPNVSRQEVH